MKIQIDTTAKVIRIDGIVNLGEMTKELNKLFPRGEWKTYKLDAQKQIEHHYYPYYNPWPLFEAPTLPFIPCSSPTLDFNWDAPHTTTDCVSLTSDNLN